MLKINKIDYLSEYIFKNNIAINKIKQEKA